MLGRMLLRRGAAATALAGLILLSGCLAPSRMPPERAFALSASALSGRDGYSYDGEWAAYSADGAALGGASYRGLVSDHRPLVLLWDGPGAAGGGQGHHPLALSEAAQLQASEIAYAPPPSRGTVAFRITLRPEAARRAVAEPLRRQVEEARRSLDARIDPSREIDRKRRAKAFRALGRSEAELEERLASLEASTVFTWIADRRTWFPKELREETELRYEADGRERRERRTSVTIFRKGGFGDTMGS